MNQQTYCCTWCHKDLSEGPVYVLESGSTVCEKCRGFSIPLTLWNKPCKRAHDVSAKPKPQPTPRPKESDIQTVVRAGINKGGKRRVSRQGAGKGECDT